jgi:hypothetical protein
MRHIVFLLARIACPCLTVVACDRSASYADSTIPAGTTASVIPPSQDSLRAAAEAESTVVAMLWETRLDSARSTLPSSCSVATPPIDAFIPVAGTVARTIISNLRGPGATGPTADASVYADVITVAEVKSAGGIGLCETNSVVVAPHIATHRIQFRLQRQNGRWRMQAPLASDSSYGNRGGVALYGFDIHRVGSADSLVSVSFSPSVANWSTLRTWTDSIRRSGSRPGG